MASEIEIIIRAVDKASKDINQMTSKSKSGFDKFQAAVIAGGVAISGAMILAKKAFDMGKEGAQLEYAREKFDRLSSSVGTTSDALLKDLRKATRGTRSDMELVGSAADFMSLGLAKSHDQVVRLTRVAGALNMDMNQLVLTLANRTTMRFDQLGVAVDGFDAKVKKLEKTGMSTNDAFTEAFLLQAEEQITKVGDVAETSAGKIMKMEAQVANLSDSFKLRMAPAVAESAEAIANAIGQLEEWNQEIEQAKQDGVEFDSTLRAYKGGFVGVTEAVTENTSALFDERKETIEAWKATQTYTDMLEDNTEGVDDNTEAVKNNERHQGILEGRLRGLKTLIDGELGDSYDDFTEKNTELWEETVILTDKIADLEQRKYLTKEQKEELEEAKKKLDDVSKAATENADAHDEATSRILLNLLEQQLAIGGWTDQEFMFLQEVANRWGLIDDKTLEATQGMQTALNEFAKSKDVSDAADALDMIKAKVLAIPTDINVNVRVRYSEGGGVGGGAPSDWKDKKPRQHGGPVSPGEMYLVGERGPELFTPSTSGYIVPNSNISNYWNLTINEAGQRGNVVMDFEVMKALARA